MAADAGALVPVLVVLVGAKLGGEAAERLRQPAVLGELAAGVLLAASLLGGFVGVPDLALAQEAARLEASAGDPGSVAAAGAFFLDHGAELGAVQVLSFLAALGAILLLFQVGLESDLRAMARVGPSSLLVALLGVAVSFALGYLFSWGLAAAWAPWRAAAGGLPPHLLHVFLGATLTATSVGITARVLSDMGRLRSREARIILGAAVLDDVVGLVVLAVAAALIASAAGGEPVSGMALLRVVGVALGFLAVAFALGQRGVPLAFDFLVGRFRVAGFPVALAVAFALGMAYLASLAGLAEIVGAFAAGVLLARSGQAHGVAEALRPVAALFVAFFFVVLGMRVDVTRMGGQGWQVVAIGLGLAAVAVAAKLACGWGVLRRDRASRLVVGVGMAPRGEVGLIFAAVGLESGLLANWQYAALLLVVLATTFITPPWLRRLAGSFHEDGTPAGTVRATMDGNLEGT